MPQVMGESEDRRHRSIGIAILGAGNIAKAVIGELVRYNGSATALPGGEGGVTLSLEMVANSRYAVGKEAVSSGPNGAAGLAEWMAPFASAGSMPATAIAHGGDHGLLYGAIASLFDAHPFVVVIDCTCGDEMQVLYEMLLSTSPMGGRTRIVTANKKPMVSGRGDIVCRLQDRIYFESTVGAGIPVIRTVKALLSSGDTIRRIEGILSGTLGYLCNTFMPLGGATQASPSFLSIVEEARLAGYTEPDPCEDLSGMDVARKVTILARLMGLAVASPEEICHSLLPKPAGPSAAPFSLTDKVACAAFDAQMDRLREGARKDGLLLRYVATISGKATPAQGVTIALKGLDASSSLCNARGSDNIIVLTTDRFPGGLVLQGSGAGPSSTAHGILSDLDEIRSSLAFVQT